MTQHQPSLHVFSSYDRFVMMMLAFLQFTVILDFMIMAPMGAILMPKLHISPAQFGFAVSVYAFGAALSGIVASGFADRFDRKRFLLFFYVGFLIGTFLCGLVTSYEALVAARAVTGVFAGVIASIVMAIVTDLFPFAARGRVMGFVQTAFSTSQILGLPLGLFLATHLGWHSPFFFIGGLGIVAGFIISSRLKPIRKHLRATVDRRPLHHMVSILTNRSYLFALLATGLLVVGGYMMLPFSSAFMVHNLGISLDHLPYIYFLVGGVTLFAGPLIGRFSDRFGKFPVFVAGSIVTVIMVVIYTNLEQTPLLVVATIIATMFLGIFSRMIPAQAIVSAVPAAKSRGGFMAVSSSIQQVAGGAGSMLAGHIVTEGANGRIEHFPILGLILIGTAALTIFQMYFINRSVLARLKDSNEEEIPIELL